VCKAWKKKETYIYVKETYTYVKETYIYVKETCMYVKETYTKTNGHHERLGMVQVAMADGTTGCANSEVQKKTSKM